MSRKADVVVVGSGAGGGPVALTLARAGADVVMLERGKRYQRSDFVHDEIRIARREFFVPSAATDPHVVVVKGREPERTNEGWIASCVGGGTVHMSGFFYRFHPEDFRVRTLLGRVKGANLADWPVTYDDMKPYYRQVEKEIGISGPQSEGPFAPPRDGPYAMKPLATHPAAAIIDAAATKRGATPFETPRAIISEDYEGRGKCVYCHLCGSFGCETGAKSSTLATLIPKAEATGKCEVMAETMVVRIEAEGGVAKRVVYRDVAGHEHAVEARVVVVACSAIESARLLLLSEVANENGQVGKHLMFSTLSKAHAAFSYAKDAARAEVLKDYAPFLGRSILDYYLPKERGAPKKAGALNFLFPSGGPVYQSETQSIRGTQIVWGQALKDRLKQYWLEEKQIECETFGEYMPTDGTRVELDAAVKDQFDLPAARILIDRHAHDAKVSSYLADKAVGILEEAGADRVWTSNLTGRTMHLPMGGCRMGTDPATSVVDATCKTHSVKNLYVTDGSVFPSSGAVPPTYTILANSFRVGEAIRDRLAQGDL